MSIFLCGNTGCVNRGCEAIIRSTVKIIKQRTGDIYLGSFAPDQDRTLSSELGINMIPYEEYPSRIVKYFCGGIHKVLHKSLVHHNFIQRELWGRIKKSDICLNIGGDTYCYKNPEASIALNHYAYKNGVKCILWCCSIEKEKMTGEILKDLKRYSCIFAREQITYRNLIEAGIPQNKVIHCCDPAFFLDMQEVPLPDSFLLGNTVCINISEMVVKKDDITVYPAILGLVKYILNNTDMNICLIPHVYSIEENKCDYPVLKRLYSDLNCSRVSLINEELNCEQLKYIISNCRFAIAARTHASIAAYSTCVPTLVLGYSVKSRGIAMDLFGQSEKYVIPYTDIQKAEQLIDAFQFLMKNEDVIRTRLTDFLPEYKKTLISAIEKHISDPRNNMLCDHRLCTGCGACASVCPVQSIKMRPDENGFIYPFTDEEKCIECGKCAKICPVSNRATDNGSVPYAYAVQNKDEEIKQSSSSGGVFFELGKAIIEKGGVVIGAAFDSEFSVKHICCDSIELLPRLMGSKYVQSDLGNVFQDTKEYLHKSIPVLFTGTPCQIAGLKAYLNDNPVQLYTQDVVCHGVPTPELWEKYKQYRQGQEGSMLSAVSFRSKVKGWKNFSLMMNFQNCHTYSETVGKDSYLQLFVNDYSVRDVCNMCPFRTMHRQADITLADFWNINKVVPQIVDDFGTSLVLIHSDKGAELMRTIEPRVRSVPVSFNDVQEVNSAILKNKPENYLHQTFLKDMKRKSYQVLEKEYSMGSDSLKKKLYWSYVKQLFM